jgi:CubicO group peptidase (beta-lactamase class C family)
MTRSAGIVGEHLRPHLVTRAEGLPFGPGRPVSFEGDLWESSDSGAAAVHTSAPDLIRFGQMILNGGLLDGVRVLSPSTVTAMVTNQIPGVPARFGGGLIPDASWGYGFTVVQEQRFAYFAGGLVPLGSALHPGAGGISYWIDFANEVVGVFFEVITEVDEFLVPISGIGHRFQDVITGAVVG